MNWEAVGAIAEGIGGLGVILTLVYLSLQIRGSNRVAKAQSRHSMSEFAMGISRFRAEHADGVLPRHWTNDMLGFPQPEENQDEEGKLYR
jgi:hypothetical protein